MPDFLKALIDLVDHFERWSVVTFITLIGIGVVVLVVGRKTDGESSQKRTGDKVIDDTIQRLADLKKNSSSPTESQIAEALGPLFRRPAFYGIREESWNSFLYVICRTRLLLEDYADKFKSSAAVRANIDRAIQNMVRLQNSVATIYGPNFSVTSHIRSYIDDEKKFLDALPRVLNDPTPQFFDSRDADIGLIRAQLHAAGLIDGPAASSTETVTNGGSSIQPAVTNDGRGKSTALSLLADSSGAAASASRRLADQLLDPTLQAKLESKVEKEELKHVIMGLVSIEYSQAPLPWLLRGCAKPPDCKNWNQIRSIVSSNAERVSKLSDLLEKFDGDLVYKDLETYKSLRFMVNSRSGLYDQLGFIQPPLSDQQKQQLLKIADNFDVLIAQMKTIQTRLSSYLKG